MVLFLKGVFSGVFWICSTLAFGVCGERRKTVCIVNRFIDKEDPCRDNVQMITNPGTVALGLAPLSRG